MWTVEQASDFFSPRFKSFLDSDFAIQKFSNLPPRPLLMEIFESLAHLATLGSEAVSCQVRKKIM
jgi:hypothetical protein